MHTHRKVVVVYREIFAVYFFKTKDETDMRNRYVAETQTDKL